MMKPIFSTSAVKKTTFYVEPRAYSARIEGLTNWVGTNGAVVKLDVADPRMKEKGYAAECSEVGEVTDEEVQDRIREVTSQALSRYTFVKKVKYNNEELQKWLDLGVYVPEDAGDARVAFIDMGLDPPPTLWTPVAGPIVENVVNAEKAADVTYLGACYDVTEEFETKVRRQVGRKRKK
jgi:hypothetical protein